MPYDRQAHDQQYLDAIKRHLDRGDESWQVGQLILHATRRRHIALPTIANFAGVTTYRLRKIRDGYLRRVGVAA